MKFHFYILFLFLLLPAIAWGQDTLAPKKKTISLSRTAKALEKSLKEEDPRATAQGYEELADALVETGDYARAESYLVSALALYADLGDDEKVVRLTRRLARVQENQQKFDEAISSYQTAGDRAGAVPASQLNYNDAQRLSNRTDPEVERGYIDANLEIAEEADYEEEKISLYRQQAESNLRANQPEAAVESYGKALKVATDKPEVAVKLKQEVADVYAVDNRLEEAIVMAQSALEQAQNTGSVDEVLNQQQQLAKHYHQAGQTEQALTLLEESYQQALEQGRTQAAKQAVQSQVEIFENQGASQQSVQRYTRFMEDFESLIARDSTLVDTKLFAATEEKIRQLENERRLKDALLAKSKTFNTVLIASVLLMLGLLTWIAKSLLSIKNKNKRIALQSLRREMNPHFIFNSLNSVNQFIAQNDERAANKYLTSYSTLMRTMMETSNKDFVSLSEELGQLKKYLALEHLRFRDSFDYIIEVDETLDSDAAVPNMLIQPHLENAIWHGLRYKEEKGLLQLRFRANKKGMEVVVEDNGIGMEQSRALKTQNQKVHPSRGLHNVSERIKLLNQLYGLDIRFETQKPRSGTGTVVKLHFPQS